MSDREDDEPSLRDDRSDFSDGAEEAQDAEEDEDFAGDVVADGHVSEQMRKRKPEERVTTNYMTKYERARVLGTRALQISMNAPVLVELEGETDPLTIAQKELRQRVLPIVIRRILPDNAYEDWRIPELEVEFDRPADDRYTNL